VELGLLRLHGSLWANAPACSLQGGGKNPFGHWRLGSREGTQSQNGGGERTPSRRTSGEGVAGQLVTGCLPLNWKCMLPMSNGFGACFWCPAASVSGLDLRNSGGVSSSRVSDSVSAQYRATVAADQSVRNTKVLNAARCSCNVVAIHIAVASTLTAGRGIPRDCVDILHLH
jgi:hypothetical protein